MTNAWLHAERLFSCDEVLQRNVVLAVTRA